MHYTEHQPGHFSWNELLTTDSKSAVKFYTGVFGWTTREVPMGPDFVYTILQKNGEDVGGLMQLSKECGNATPAWRSVVTVEDVEATAKKVVELGGKIVMEPCDIPNVGRCVVFLDPQGLVLTAIKYFPRA